MRNSPRCQPFVLQAGECLCSTTPTPFVLDGDRSKQSRGGTIKEVLRRADLSEVNADLPVDSKPVWLVCGECLARLKCVLENPGGRLAGDLRPDVSPQTALSGRLGHII